MRIDAELSEPPGIKNTRFARGEPVRDPQHRSRSAFDGIEARGERKNEPACGTGVIHRQGADFRDGIEQQSARQRLVQIAHAERQPGARVCGISRFLQNGIVCPFGGDHGRQGSAFESGDLFAQGKKRLLRRGSACHGVSSIPICSLYVLMDSRGGRKSQQPPCRNLFLICYRIDSLSRKNRARGLYVTR